MMITRIGFLTLALCGMLRTPLPAQGKGCAPTINPKTLPAAHDIIDSAAVIAELGAFNKLGDQMMFSLVYMPDDSIPHVSPLAGADEQSAFVLLRSIWPQKPAGTWALRVAIVRDEAHGTSSLAIERSIFCPPVLEPITSGPSMQYQRIRVQVRPGDHMARSGTGRVSIRLDLTVDEGGNVGNVHITQSTGVADLDDALSQQWETRKFKPALIDGVPIKAIFRVGSESPRM